ncbi:hypothetical protein [Rosistilla oblonga]|uniref:DUF3352 domain-containing protein n=1 Tax=Rosistilla oblonga TaxID=2527990 RepID=A0A518J1J2_9BACT|nr:hypothetical protein [Rosistilla oblonga]QDV59216.1 hypothetical protein Mal33_52440 [Rosistilla oblonga]
MLRHASQSLLILLLVATAVAADPAERFPDDTRLFVSIANFKSFQEKLSATSMGKLWNSPPMADFRSEFTDSQQDFSARLRRAYGFDDKQLKKYATGTFTVAGLESKPDELSMSFLIEMSAESAQKMIDEAGEQIVADGGRISDTSFPIAAKIYDLPDDQQVLYAYTDHGLLISGDVAIATRIVSGWADAANWKSLQSVAAYQRMTAAPPRDGVADIRWFADVIRLAVVMNKKEGTVSSAHPDRPPFPLRHGFAGIQGIGGFCWVSDDGFDFLNDVQIDAPPPRQQALKSLDFNAGDLTPPAFVHDTTSNTMVNRWNLRSMLANIGDVYDDITDAPGAWVATLDDWKNDLGFDLIDGLLPMLEPELVTHSDYVVDAKQERTLIAIPIQNPKLQERRVASLIYRFLRNDNKAIRSRLPRQKYDLWEIALQDKQGNSTFTRAGIMVANGRLWISTHATMVQHVVLGAEGNPLSESQEFTALTQRMQPWTTDQSFMRGFVRGDRDIRHSYEVLRSEGLEGLKRAESMYGNMLLMLLKSDEGRPQPDTDFSKLPPFADVQQYFGMIGSVGNLTDSGWTIVIGAFDRQKTD